MAQIREKGTSCMVLVGKTEVNRQLGRRGRGCENNVKKDLKLLGRERVDWSNLAE